MKTAAEVLAEFDLTVLAAMVEARDRYEVQLQDAGATEEETVAALALQDRMMLAAHKENRAQVQRLLSDPDAPSHGLH